MTSKTNYVHFLERAVDQRRRAGAIKIGDAKSVAKRSFLLKMAERNEAAAELRMRTIAGQPTAPAEAAMRRIDSELVTIRSTLSLLGVDIRRKR